MRQVLIPPQETHEFVLLGFSASADAWNGTRGIYENDRERGYVVAYDEPPHRWVQNADGAASECLRCDVLPHGLWRRSIFSDNNKFH